MNKFKITIFNSKKRSYYWIFADFRYVILTILSNEWCWCGLYTFFSKLGPFFYFFTRLNNQCTECRYEQEIISIQSKLRISKFQGQIILDKNNPNFRNMNFGWATCQNLTLLRPQPPPLTSNSVNIVKA